jgi:hypothetical protein
MSSPFKISIGGEKRKISIRKKILVVNTPPPVGVFSSGAAGRRILSSHRYQV